MTKSKRFWITIAILIVNLIIFIIGLYNNINLIDLATALGLLESPVLVYLWGETKRKTQH